MFIRVTSRNYFLRGVFNFPYFYISVLEKIVPFLEKHIGIGLEYFPTQFLGSNFSSLLN